MLITRCWERLKVGGEGDDRGWEGWMASPTQWTWVWVNSRCWWWTGRPGVLQSIGSQSQTQLTWIELTEHDTNRIKERIIWLFINRYIWQNSRPQGHNREGNGSPLQYSCLENPVDRGAWWAAVYGVTQSRTRLKWLSSTSSKDITMSEGSQTQKSTHYSIFIKFEYRQNWWHYKSIRAVPFDTRKVGVTGRRHRGYWYAHIVLLDELVVGWFTRMHWICKNSLSYDLWFVKFFCIIFQ